MGRIPKLLHGEGLARNLEAKFGVFVGHEFSGHAVVSGARDSAPILFAVVKALEGNGGEFLDEVFDAVAVDVLVGFLARLKRIVGIFVVVEEKFVHVARQAEAVRLLDLRAGTHLGRSSGGEYKGNYGERLHMQSPSLSAFGLRANSSQRWRPP